MSQHWIEYFKGLSKNGSKTTVFNDDYMAFWDTETNPEQPLLKAMMGLVYDPVIGTTIPGIVLGAGDGQGNNRAYIEKDEQGFKLIYRISPSLVSGIKFANDGRILINDYEVATLENAVLQQEYVSDSSLWNAKLSGMTYENSAWKNPSSKLSQQVNDDIAKGVGAYTNQQYGDFSLYYNSNRFFEIYNGVTQTSVDFYNSTTKKTFVTFNKADNRFYPQGIWDFSNCTIAGGIDVIAVFG